MRNKLMAVALLSFCASGCAGSSTTSTMGPTPVASATGTWSGTASDSSTATLGNTGMMGQAGMGLMTWQLTQNGSAVSGRMSFSGMPAMMQGTMSGTISGADMAFTIDMPAGSMNAAACSAHATGTAHIDGSTMAGSYSGSNSCAGPFTNGQMTMNRQ